MELHAILKETELFSDCDDGVLQKIAHMGNVKEFHKGDIVFKEGSGGDTFFIVIRGLIAINKNVAGGKKRNLSNVKRGDIFGEFSLFDREPRSADAVALEDSQLIIIQNKQFLELLKEFQDVAFTFHNRIITILCKRLRATDDLLKEGVIWGFKMDF